MASTDVDMGGLDLIVNKLKIGATKPGAAGSTLDATELGYLDGATSANSGTNKLVVTGTSGALTVAGALTPSAGIVPLGTASPRCFHTGQTAAQASTDFTDQTPVATEVYFSEVFIPINVTLTGVSLFRGSVSSGNIKVGLANSAGVVVATSASTASSGTDSYLDIAFTSTYPVVGPGTYYVLAFYDNNTVRANAHTIGRFVAGKQTGQTFSTGFTTITPGTSFTTALGPVATLY